MHLGFSRHSVYKLSRHTLILVTDGRQVFPTPPSEEPCLFTARDTPWTQADQSRLERCRTLGFCDKPVISSSKCAAHYVVRLLCVLLHVLQNPGRSANV